MADVNQIFAEAVARHQAGDFAMAERLYRSMLAEAPNHAAALCNLGALHSKTNRFEEAIHCFQLALKAIPGYPDAHFNLGNLYRRQNKFREAVAQYTACLKGNPQHMSAGFNLGIALVGLGDLKSAEQCFSQVVQADPKFADAWGRLGDTQMRLGSIEAAIAAFEKYCELQPDDHRGQNNLALALANAGRHTDAIELLQKLLKKKPDYAEGHNTLGVALEAIGRKDDALFHYEQAVAAKADYPDPWSNRGINLLESGRADEAIDCLKKSVELRGDAPAVYSNLLLALNYSSRYSPQDVADEHRRWGERFGGKTPPDPVLPQDLNPKRLIRIGYVSADFRAHTIAGFIEALFRGHDRRHFHVTGYPNVARPDETTEKLKNLSDAWRPIVGLSDEQVARMVMQDKIDVLVDLGGHTAGNRMLTFARRPAPLQLTMFGYPNTTGLAAVDFRVTDPISDPVGVTEPLSVEKLMRLPTMAWCYLPPSSVPDVGPLPGANRKAFTFGCLNNAAKISDDCLATWANILKAIPGSKLVLLAGQSNIGAKRLADRFGKAGILRDRVELVFRLPKEQYFSAYQGFDLALDPFPYNGGVTTCDALWMGVPVLTVEGSSYVSRQGLAVLATLGLPGFIARTAAELPEIAKGWANRRDELSKIRKGLREQMAASPVCDTTGYVRSFEKAISEAWAERLSLLSRKAPKKENA